MSGTQEIREKRGTVMLSDDEKRDLHLVAALLDVTESDLLRDFRMSEIVEKADAIRKQTRAA